MNIREHALYLRVADIERSLRFYRDGLGFVVERTLEGEEGTFWARLVKDGVVLMVSTRPSRIFEHEHEAGEEEHRFRSAASVHVGELNVVLYLYVEDADAAFEVLRSRGLETVDEPKNKFYGVREFLVRDPDGYYYAVGQRLS